METLIMLGQQINLDNPPEFASGLDIKKLLHARDKDGLCLRMGDGEQCGVLGYLLVVSELGEAGLYEIDHAPAMAKDVRHALKRWNARFPGELAKVLIILP